MGTWGADSSNIYMVAHSLGNLVALDALRLYAVDHPTGDQPLIKHMVSVEAAVWEETLWEEAVPLSGLNGNRCRSSSNGARGRSGSTKQDHSIFAATEHMVNSWVIHDEALVGAMKLNDVLPFLGRVIVITRWRGFLCPCPCSTSKTGATAEVLVLGAIAFPFTTGLENEEAGNRPDLPYEVPALYEDSILFLPRSC